MEKSSGEKTKRRPFRFGMTFKVQSSKFKSACGGEEEREAREGRGRLFCSKFKVQSSKFKGSIDMPVLRTLGKVGVRQKRDSERGSGEQTRALPRRRHKRIVRQMIEITF